MRDFHPTLIRGLSKAYLLLLLTAALLSGCATLPEGYPRPVSVAYPDYQKTSVGRFFEEAVARHPGESGFAIIRQGHDAFTGRIAMTELAEQSIDVQYYIWESDATGRILADQLVRAADRGVRVRALVDDNKLEGRDAIVAALDAHPNIEIRVFNPFANRDRHIFDFLVDLDRINHRMHNKLMVMDNSVAIIGGRNIGNHYFDVATDANFRDLDIAAVGPLVRETSSVFDYFWNGNWSVPISALVKRRYEMIDLQTTIEAVRDRIAKDPYPYDLDQDVEDLTAALASIRERLIWATGRIIWDDPSESTSHHREGKVAHTLFARVDELQNELLIESAYFVSRSRSVEVARQLQERGVRVRVLTNSLSSNDVVAAHAGYTKRRSDLIANGVEIHELRHDAGVVKQKVFSGDLGLTAYSHQTMNVISGASKTSQSVT